jgi:hypothetical protein
MIFILLTFVRLIDGSRFYRLKIFEEFLQKFVYVDLSDLVAPVNVEKIGDFSLGNQPVKLF